MAIAKVLQFLRRRTILSIRDSAADADLLRCFIAERDEGAFAELLNRHAAMVWGVCKRNLGHDQDAEDAFQATFLVLVRKAAVVRPASMVGNWLYGVACNVAQKARAMSIRRLAREKQLPVDAASSEANVSDDMLPFLDQELSRLPEKYRSVIVLCDLEGKTRREAAAQLGVPEGTIGGRHARARALLAKRLARHGLASAGLTQVLTAAASAAPPATLPTATLQTACAGAQLTSNVAFLVDAALKTMLVSKMKSALLLIAIAAGLIGGALSIGAFSEGRGESTKEKVGKAAKDVAARTPLVLEASDTGKTFAVDVGHTIVVLLAYPTPKAFGEGGVGASITPSNDCIVHVITPDKAVIQAARLQRQGRADCAAFVFKAMEAGKATLTIRVFEKTTWEFKDFAVDLIIKGAAGKEKAGPDDPIFKEQARLEGEWELVSLVVKGKIQKHAKTYRIRFKGDTSTSLTDEEPPTTAVIKIDPQRTPRHMDYGLTEGPGAGRTLHAIYRIDGDQLTVCCSLDDSTRPTDFVSSGATPSALHVYRRVGK